ncbi:DUF2285 domain-containing protein [Phenylobacterium soli]|uniref:DUF2285 domain-containing protein n=1 Tax=Phenylobacterium soli TaxID=2170551 RepID=A0A328AJ92_9CAUL|nr:DUF2285 domain-containing protein [Phenylobacterium soli]RAK54922.1 DUF2285 domain-containing protein [Phenylobacterium soli]
MHALLRTPTEAHRLWMPTPLRCGDPIACVVPSGGEVSVATTAALQFLRRLSGQTERAEPRLRAHDQRAQMSLVALDEHRAGATYRNIAERLYGAARVAAEDWRTSALRDSTIRLVRTGERLARGHHLQLLGRKSEL